MKLDKSFFENEIRQAERLVKSAEDQAVYAKGGLDVLRQLSELLSQEEMPSLVDHTNAE